jgi:hypothetical protein
MSKSKLEISIRPEVKNFAETMEAVLRTKDHLFPKGWQEDSLFELLRSADNKILDLDKVLEGYLRGDDEKDDVIKLCVDVANFVMMIADKVSKEEK